MTDEQLISAINRVVTRGGEVRVNANDPLNPQGNAQARVITDIGLKKPTNIMRGGLTGRSALEACFASLAQGMRS